MGAYENPAIIVDTETPKIYANAISNFGEQITSAINKEIANRNAQQLKLQKDKEEMYKRGAENLDKVIEQGRKAGINSPQQWELLSKITSDVTASGTRGMQASNVDGVNAALKETAKLKNQQSQMIMNATLQKNVSDPEFDKYTESMDSWGNQGSLSLQAGKNYEYIVAKSIGKGFRDGEQFTYFDENNIQKTKFTSPTLDKEKYPDGITWDTALLNSYNPIEIPDITNKIKSIYRPFDQEKNPKGLGILDKNNELTSGYYDIENPKTINLPDGRKQTVYPALANKINAATKGIVDAEIAGLLANPDAARSVWKDVFNKESDLNISTDGTAPQGSVFSIADTKAFSEAYRTYSLGVTIVPDVKYGDIYTPAKDKGGDGGKDQIAIEKAQTMYDNFAKDPLEFLKGAADFSDITSGIYNQGPTPAGTPPNKVRVEISPKLTKDEKNGPSEAKYRTFDLANKNDLSALWQFYTVNSNYGQSTKDKMLDVGNLNKKENLSAEDLIAKYSTGN